MICSIILYHIIFRQRRARGSVVGACSGRRPWEWRRAPGGAVGFFLRREEGGTGDDHEAETGRETHEKSWSQEDSESCNGQLGRSGDQERTHGGDSAVAGKFLAELRDDHRTPKIADHIVAQNRRFQYGPVVRDHGSVAKERCCLQSAAREGVSLLH